MDFNKFAAKPFDLDDRARAWVAAQHRALTLDEKLRQLFTLIAFGADPEALEAIRQFRPGGVTRMQGGSVAEEREILRSLNDAVPTPLLVSADLEGSRMSLSFGADWPNPLALAAIDDLNVTRDVSRAMAAEARAAGINWSFTPVLDINHAFRSAIVATRGFGSDVSTIERHALAQMLAFQEAGIAAAVKHFPGEGYDDRDQHLLTTINPLSLDEWDKTFGRLYRAAIEQSVLSVMSAHIAFPDFARDAMAEEGVEAYRPASISRHLNQTLLRERLGFEGLIVSDATPMAGLGSWSKRSEHLPEVIASGCDVILFSEDPETDLAYLYAALEDGRLTEARVDDAVARQLAMKAALGLHVPQDLPAPPDPAVTEALAARAAHLAPTLVKDVQGLLPLTNDAHRRVLILSPGINMPFLPHPLPFAVPDMLAAHGFEVTLFQPGMKISPESFDLILFIFGDETLLTRGRIFIDWLKLTGNFGAAMQRLWHEVPTAMISFGYPYLLYDAPRMPCVINAYSTTDIMQEAVVDLLLGKGDWNRNSPVDPYCGLEDARY